MLAGLDQRFISYYCQVFKQPVGLCIEEQYIARDKKICTCKLKAEIRIRKHTQGCIQKFQGSICKKKFAYLGC